MTRMHPILAAAILLLLAASPALAKSYNLRTLEVADPWTRPAPAGGTAVGYMVLTNHGKTPLSLLSAHTALAKTVSLHQTRVAAGVASMAVVPRGIVIPPGQTGAFWFEARDPEPLTTFADSLDLTLSSRRYTALSIPSGETLDALAVWLPDEKTLFFGNWAGAILGASPNFYTARGDRDRSIVFWLEECQMMIDLAPEMLVTGHDDPVRGADAVRAHLTRLRDAVQYLHDQTLAGMNDGKTLPELMAEITLPPHLVLRDGRGPVNWYVRAIWEEYAGWFRQERTSELYATPPSAVWPELAALAGGAGVLADKARAHLDTGALEAALHLIEIAVVAEPGTRAVRETELAIYEALADRTEGRVFDELGWLESSIMATRKALDAIAGA